ncbi:hypothetical protein U9M48_032607 [Paspalum notatum var. saurae]|uniref:TMEM205-like domain-containing protein n=1 Tax=Paspalum notatum var. saurae TaxID=547442 RepID=A0AAQ3X5L1_PASNO
MRSQCVAAAMMNVVAIGLVLSTLAAAGVWSPSPPPVAQHQQHGDQVVREGRRVVIVEYQRELPLSTEDGGSVKVKETRVLPPDALDGIEGEGGEGSRVFDEARGVLSDAAGKVAGAAEEGKESLSDATESAKGGVLGAVKRCKDRLCGAGRRVEEGAKDAEHGAQLGMLQSKLFPVYFRAMAYGVGLALAAHLLGRERRSFASRAQSFNLLAALGLVLANMLFLEPKATKVMFERMKVEKEEGRGRDMADIVDPPVVTVATPTTTTTTTVPTAAAAARTTYVDGSPTGKKAKPATMRLSRQLKKLNGYSSLCNVLSLMSLTWHLVHLARRLQTGTAC